VPATVVREPLGISCVFTDGGRWSWSPGLDANPRLGADLLTGLADLVHPHGRIDRRKTVQHYGYHARTMVTRLAEQGFTGDAAELTRAKLVGFWMAASYVVETATRAMLVSLDARTGVLRPDVRDLATGRRFNAPQRSSPLSPYSEGKWTRLGQACRNVINNAYAAHREASASAATGQDPRVGGWTEDNLVWLLRQLGPVSLTRVGEHVGLPLRAVLRRGGVADAAALLFPTTNVVFAYRLLFGIYTGIVPDGIDGLGLGDLDWAGNSTVLLGYVKGRTAKESLTLAPRGVRLLEQWLDHSALLRGFLSEADRTHLWPRFVPSRAELVLTEPVIHPGPRRWIQRNGVLGDDGQPLALHTHRIRTTFEVMRDRRSWFGSARATIDPNHSPQVEGDRYLSVATPAQRRAVEEVIVGAQADLIRKTRPPVVIDIDQVAHAAARLPQLLSGLKLDDAAVTELVGGTRDVFVAACADPLSGLHGPAGKPCPARPWVCLLCPLAVFTTRHAPNLLRLKAFFTRQGKQLSSAGFLADFGPYSLRIDEVLGCFDPAVLALAASQSSDTDEELPLRPEELTR